MKRSMMAKNLRQSIRKSLGRYIAIAVIIALGAAMFVGLRTTKTDMVATGQVYTDQQNMFDLRLISTYGWGAEQVEKIAALDGVQDAEGMYYTDLIVSRGEDTESVFRFHTIPQNVDRLVLLYGRMPENGDECLADGFRNGKSAIGSTFTIADNNAEDALDTLNYRTFTVVGVISSPLYMDMNRGSTSVGSGSLSNYYYVLPEAFNVDYFTEIHVTIPGDYAIYSQEYNDALSNAADALKPLVQPIAEERMEQVRQEALDKLREGRQKYNDGLKEFHSEKARANKELGDALKKLRDGEREMDENKQKLDDAERQIADGQKQLIDGKKQLASSRSTLAGTRSSMLNEVTENFQYYLNEFKSCYSRKSEVDSHLVQISLDLVEINSYIIQFEYGLTEVSEEERQQAYDRRAELEQQQTELNAERDLLSDRLEAAETGLLEVAATQIAMDEQFAAAESQIDAAEAQLSALTDELSYSKQSIADGRKKLEEGREELAQGWEAYNAARQQADEEFAKAEEELDQAARELEDAHNAIAEIRKTDVYVLDRNTNMGYNSLDSSSDIVEGVSRVFPVFFLAVAALVCITTMTRMVDEERTQIGTLKALGYSSMSIISKYLVYAGSSSLLGCVIGIAVGNTVFPTILWEAYKIMIFINPRIELRFDWQLALFVFVMYTSAMLLVTWYCCYRALREVPAELIRPKAPAAGKSLIFERLKVWSKISFLNKVAIRNIFRYRQRLAMMLLGIGGCTALLMTGFGLRDSISKIVDVQFEEVTTYDMEVYFRNDCDETRQSEFRKTMQPYSDSILFFNQISAELSTDTQTRDIYLISSSANIGHFFNFHSGKAEVELPSRNEVLLSAGICDIMGIQVGDHIQMRNPDMEMLELTVSGIYDNHVYNYAIITPDTVQEQWGRTPDLQMAFVTVREDADVYAAGAAASGADNVMNVTISEQTADMVDTMMKALDLVVWVVVVCAGLLAAIVLYNLTNININERIREIATIKVLGFNALEAALYVFKENLVLSIMGTVFGIPMGKLLLDFVISQIRIDAIWLKARLEWPSLLISVVLTVLSAVIVDGIFYFKLETINMAEALKSVE